MTLNGSTTSRVVKAVSVEDLLAMKLPSRELILAPWLPTQGLAMIHAKRGIGKTHLAMGIACAVVSGGTFLRWSAPKPRGVLYVDGEMPAVVLQDRMRAALKAQERAREATLDIITPDLQDQGLPDLATPEGQSAIDRHILEDVSLIVLDNLSTLVRSGKENEAESWEPLQTWALGWRRRGKSVLLIHHSNKQGGQRGTSRREDVLDTVVALTRPAGYTPDQGAAFKVEFEKNRGFFGKDAAPFEASLGEDGTWTTEGVADPRILQAQEMLRQGLSQTEIAIQFGVNKSTVSRWVSGVKEGAPV